MRSTIVRLVKRSLGGDSAHTREASSFEDAAASAEPSESNTALRLAVGAVLPGTRYRLKDWRGEGAMGTVYEAEHIDLERSVALKILHHHIAKDPSERTRFRDEARMTIHIDSPHVVRVLDFGFIPDGRAFYVMEMLDGHPLSREVSQEQPCPPERVLGLMRQLCKGLSEAHRAGVIHRDVKPDNVLIVRDRERDIAKLVDFGIASQHARESGSTTAGTPYYMAPEQIHGDAFDGRLDLYALGATAYELLTGVVPFGGTTVQKVLEAHLDNPPIPPSARRPDLHIPPSLEAVILRCLEKRPEARFESADDLEAALCEAQIADGLKTTWDDLPLPDVDDRRRAFIAEHLPGVAVAGRRRQRARRIVGMLLPLVLLGGALGLEAAFGPTPDDLAEVEMLTAAAREAAADAIYVYPPANAPGYPTAYQRILELERLGGAAAERAASEAASLRRNFAEALLALGDEFWDDPASRSYARDYYAQALVFDPELPRAQARAGFTHGELSSLRQRAQERDFSPPELAATAPLRVLADDDARRGKRGPTVGTKVEGSGEATPAQLEVLANGTHPSMRSPAEEPPAEEPPAEEPPAEEPPADARASTTQPDEPVVQPKKLAGKPEPAAEAPAPDEAATLAGEGQQALRRGARTQAQELFERALAVDPRCPDALLGMSDIAFDRGAYDRALYYAQRAAEAAPNHSRIHMRLGDAYFKVLRYREALAAYEQAQRLGDDMAAARVARMQELMR